MQFSLTPQTLSQMDNVPLQYTGRALDSLDRMGQADQMGLSDLANLNEHNVAMRPMLQQHQALQNASLGVQIPGQAADADMRMRKNANEALLNPEAISAMRDKYGDEKLNHHINQLTGMGSLMMGAAEQAWNAPIGGTMAAKKMFAEADLADKWHPEWDQLPPDQLAMRLHNMGQEFVTTGSKAQSMLQQQALKGDMALAREREASASRERIASENNATKLALAKSMLEFKRQFNKQSTDQMIANLSNQMYATNDPALKATYDQHIRYLQGILERIKTQPGATFSVDESGNFKMVNKKDETGGGTPPQGATVPSNVTKSGW